MGGHNARTAALVGWFCRWIQSQRGEKSVDEAAGEGDEAEAVAEGGAEGGHGGEGGGHVGQLEAYVSQV